MVWAETHAHLIQWQHLSYSAGESKVGKTGVINLQVWSRAVHPFALQYLHVNHDGVLLARAGIDETWFFS